MIDNGLGFQLVPWLPSLERELGRQVSGIAGSGGVDWNFGRKRELSHDPPISAPCCATLRRQKNCPCADARRCALPLAMSATRILWGQLLFARSSCSGFLWPRRSGPPGISAYQPKLGPAWFMIGRCPIYQRLAFFIGGSSSTPTPRHLHAGRLHRRQRRDRRRRLIAIVLSVGGRGKLGM